MSLTLLLLVLASCTKVPVTERGQLDLVPQKRIMRTTKQQYKKFLKQHPIIKNTAKTQKLKEVGQRIAGVVDSYLRKNGFRKLAKSFKWEFNLVKSDKVNAWCMPGGKVVFYSGIMPICQDKNGMAVVMGHEIAHAVARHGSERMSQKLSLRVVGSVLSMLIGVESGIGQELFRQVYGIGAKVGMMLPYSRLHEGEADRMGLHFMAMAGYNPKEAVDFWQRMAEQSGDKPPEFLSTHPGNKTRIKNLKKYVDTAMEHYKPKSPATLSLH